LERVATDAVVEVEAVVSVDEPLALPVRLERDATAGTGMLRKVERWRVAPAYTARALYLRLCAVTVAAEPVTVRRGFGRWTLEDTGVGRPDRRRK